MRSDHIASEAGRRGYYGEAGSRRPDLSDLDARTADLVRRVAELEKRIAEMGK